MFGIVCSDKKLKMLRGTLIFQSKLVKSTFKFFYFFVVLVLLNIFLSLPKNRKTVFWNAYKMFTCLIFIFCAGIGNTDKAPLARQFWRHKKLYISIIFTLILLDRWGNSTAAHDEILRHPQDTIPNMHHNASSAAFQPLCRTYFFVQHSHKITIFSRKPPFLIIAAGQYTLIKPFSPLNRMKSRWLLIYHATVRTGCMHA